MANSVHQDAADEKVSIERSEEQGPTLSLDTKVHDDVAALSRQDTPTKEDGTTAAPVAVEESRFLTGRRLIIVHTAMLLSYAN